MIILIGLLTLAGAGCYFFVFRSSVRWNADPRQQELAQLLMRTAGHDGHYIRDQDIVSYVALHGWRSGEARRRVAHAGSIARDEATATVCEDVKRSVVRIRGGL